jgi:hypothetical protein
MRAKGFYTLQPEFEVAIRGAFLPASPKSWFLRCGPRAAAGFFTESSLPSGAQSAFDSVLNACNTWKLFMFEKNNQECTAKQKEA